MRVIDLRTNRKCALLKKHCNFDSKSFAVTRVMLNHNQLSRVISALVSNKLEFYNLINHKRIEDEYCLFEQEEKTKVVFVAKNKSVVFLQA